MENKYLDKVNQILSAILYATIGLVVFLLVVLIDNSYEIVLGLYIIGVLVGIVAIKYPFTFMRRS